MRVKKDVDLSSHAAVDVEEPIANRYALEVELISSQQDWVSRIANLFMGSLGLLAGMSLLHLILVILIPEEDFLVLYSKQAMQLNLLFLVLANFCFVFGLAVSLVYH